MKASRFNYWKIYDGKMSYLLPKTESEIKDKISEEFKENELRKQGINLKHVREVDSMNTVLLENSIISIDCLIAMLQRNIDGDDIFRSNNENFEINGNSSEYLLGLVETCDAISEKADIIKDELLKIISFGNDLSVSISVKNISELKEKMNGKVLEPVE